MPPTRTHLTLAQSSHWFNEAYRMMDELSTTIEYDAYRNRASAIAVQIDALHHDYVNHMQMEIDGS